MNRVLLLTKNDFEGMACGILLKYIHDENIDLSFHNYKASVNEMYEVAKSYEIVIAVGLKNMNQLNLNSELLICTNFEDLYSKCNDLYYEDFDNPTLEVFKQNISAYIDWSWVEKKLYFGKNIDELSKYLGKPETINKIADRISCNQDLITNTEKELLIFAKKIMTNNIQNKRYEILNVNNKVFAVTYAEMYEIELANHILSQEKNIDAVVIFNMTTKIARIKTARGISMERAIVDAGGLTNSNGGTIRFGPAFDKTIFMSILNKL